MTKCTLCHPRLEAGGQPACVSACPTDALRFGDLDAPGAVEAVPGFPRTPARPSIRFFPAAARAAGATAPDPDLAGFDAATMLPEPVSKIGLTSEWPLLLFTLITTWLVAWMGAAAVAPVPIAPLGFVGAGLAAMALSTAHLGRPLRAWRAIRNVRRSWLSREVAAWSVFLGCGSAQLLLAPEHRLLRGVALAAGVVCLFSIDRVYDVARGPGGLPVHSAETIVAAPFLLALFAGAWLPALGLGAGRALLYAYRKAAGRRAGRVTPLLPAVLRVGVGLALPVLLVGRAGPTAWALLAAAVGEVLDRGEYYAELEIPTPARQVRQDLVAAILAGAARP